MIRTLLPAGSAPWQWSLPALAATIIVAGWIGCSSSPSTKEIPVKATPAGIPEEPPPPPPVPFAERNFPYRIQNDGCNCEEYRLVDPVSPVEFRFRAKYRMENGIVTTIEIEFSNNTGDTLRMDHGTVRVSSMNVQYQYNNKFVPLPFMLVPPHETDLLKLSGRDITGVSDWKKIAGEQLGVTIRGVRLGDRDLGEQTVTFVPVNPMMEKD